MKNNDIPISMMDLKELLPKLGFINRNEKRFVNHMFDKLNIEPDEIEEIRITTSAEEIGDLMVHIIRSYNYFSTIPDDYSDNE